MQDQDIAREAESLSAESRRLYRIRHSLAHVLAQAVMEFRPGTKLGFGPPIENGFYYDFDLPGADHGRGPAEDREEDAPRSSRRSRPSSARSSPRPRRSRKDRRPWTSRTRTRRSRDLGAKGVARHLLLRERAVRRHVRGTALRDDRRDPAGRVQARLHRRRLLERQREEQDADPHLRARLRRRGRSWTTTSPARKLALERDHKKLGRELDLFHIEDEIGKGLILWLPKGTVLRDEVEDLVKETEFRYGYQRVATPHIARQELYYRSGHLPYYKESMFPPLVLEDPRASPPTGTPGRQAEAAGGLLPQADELPAPPHDLPRAAALLPRPAAAPGRVRHLLPLRAVGRAVGAAARALLHHERRPHLLRAGAAQGGDRLAAAPCTGSSTSSSSTTATRCASRCTTRPEPDKYHGRRGALGAGGERSCARRSTSSA